MNYLTDITAPIVSFVELRWFSNQNEPPASGIDMGNGHVLPVEDVLDGHFHHLIKQDRNVAIDLSEVPQQHRDRSLAPAIQKLSPSLAPLADLAADLVEQTEQAYPASQFRQSLHVALERAHQEQSAKRMLGIQPEPRQDVWRFNRWRGWTILLISLPTIVGLFVAFSLYRQTSARYSPKY